MTGDGTVATVVVDAGSASPWPRIERWTWLGSFRGQSVAKVAVWRTESGERVAYADKPHTRGGAVGFVYEVEIDEAGKWRGAATFTGDAADDVAELKLEESRERHAIALAAAERKAKTDPDLKVLLERVERFANGKTAAAREELARQLTRAVWR